MRFATPRLVVWLCCLIGLLALSAPVAVLADEANGPIGAASPEPPGGLQGGSLSLRTPFTAPLEPTPELAAVVAESRSAYKDLQRPDAVALAERTFHIDRPSWTPPGKADGAHISRYLGENSAQETLPNGKHVVISSTIPLRVDGKNGLAPVDMELRDEEGAYVPANPLVPITIAKDSGAVAFPSGVTVAPVAASAEPATTTGNSVVLANSATDTDLIVEPVPEGAELSWQLRSPESPDTNSVTLSLPASASLQMSQDMPGGAEVVSEGKRLLLIPPAITTDATGRAIPTSYSVSGSTLKTHTDLSGEVTFPVKVDPVFVGDYGVMNGANTWGSWTHVDTCGGCFQSLIFYNLIQIGSNPGLAPGNSGEWFVFAPGWGQPGGAGITRVDVSGMIHEATNQSWIQTGIESAAPSPVYSLNGFSGASGPSPFYTPATVSGIPMAFCAQGAGGADGQPVPLCDENYAGGDFYIAVTLGSPQTVFNYIRLTGAVITYWDNSPPNQVQFTSSLKSGWNQYGPSAASIWAQDQGLGISHFDVQLPAGHNPPVFEENISCNAPNGFTGCPMTETSTPINLHSLATGVYEVGAEASDPAGNVTRQSPYPKMYIDNTKPTMAALSGQLSELANTTIGNGNYALHFSAEDGSTGTPQSGVEQLQVLVDGRIAYTAKTTCPMPTGVPSSGCFALSGDWTMNGQAYGAGFHRVTVVARDWAGNTESRSLNVTVHEAENQDVGPGSVNLETGDYKLTANDVSIASANTTLVVARTFDSRSPEQGSGGPLGPSWSLSLPTDTSSGWQSLTPLSEGAVSVYTAGGDQLIFSPKTGGGWESPAGYQTDTLTEPSTSPAVYQITDAAGNYTKFTQAGTETRFTPSSVAQSVGAGGLNKVTYSFTKTAQGIVEPTKVLAPEPSEGACTSTLVKGCRALTFTYATSTTATSETQSGWGEYNGRLVRASLAAWDPAKSEMTTTAVAQYSYDTQGRLRAEWDPRISPALKTTYGYDATGRVTAETQPGLETWAFHYGTIPTDGNEGRLLSVVRPAATAPLWNGSPPANTTAPVLSGSAKVGVKMTVNNGTWSNNPVIYAYQWLRCNTSGGACAPILGATNPSYVVASADVGSTLVALVGTTNGGGSVATPTAHSATVTTGTGTEGAAPPAPEARSTVEYHVALSGTGLPDLTAGATAKWGQGDNPTEGTAIFTPDEPQSWPATDYKRAKIYYLDSRNFTVNVASPAGGITTTEYDGHNNVTRSLSPDSRATAIAAGTKSVETAQALDTEDEYNSDGSELLSVVGPQHTVKLASGSEVLARKHSRYYYDEGAPGSGGPYRLVTKTTEGALLSSGEERDVRTTKTSYSGQEGLGWKLHAPTSSEADPGNLALIHKTKYDSTTGNVLEDSSPAANSETIYPPSYAATIGSEGAGNGQLKLPGGGAFDSSGNLWVPDAGNNRVEEFSAAGSFIKVVGWGVSDGKSELQVCTTSCKAGLAGAGNGEFKSPRAIAINLGTGNLYIADTENNRVEELSSAGSFVASIGTSGSGALKEPQGVAIDPAGAIWVSDSAHNRVVEFGASNEYVREVASAEGALKAPVGIVASEGTLFVVDAGNNRVVQLSATGGALGQFGSKGSSTGQFKEPFGIAANPSTGVLYVADLGNQRVQEFSPAGRFLTVWETWGPAHQLSSPVGLAVASTGKLYISDLFGAKITTWTAPEAGAAHLTYDSQIGSSGTGSGQFAAPIGVAFDGEGNIWSTDFGNNRLEKFSAKGTFIAAYGSLGLNGPGGIDINQSTGNVYVADTNNGRIMQLTSSGTLVRTFGTEGAGKLTRPGSLKLDSAGNVWVVDMNANKLFEYSSTGTFIAVYGKEGSGEGVEFKKPVAVAVAAGNLYVADSGNHRVVELTNKGVFIRVIGKEGPGSGELYVPEGIASDGAANIYVVDNSVGHVEEFNSSGAYMATFATKGSGEGQLKGPVGDAVDAAGNLYVADTENNRLQRWTAVNQKAHITKTIYYSSGSGEAGCGGHAEWAGLPCQAQPAQQPQNRGLSNLPVVTYAYNLWDEPATTTDTVGSTTKTTTVSYDSAGRATTKAISSSVGTSLPPVTTKYSETTGLATEQSTSTKSLKSNYNKLAQLESYTDADGNASTYSYDVDGRIEKLVDGKGTQTYTYDATTGLATTLKDSAAGTFTGSYDTEGNLTTQGYPNGMNANYTFDPTDHVTNLEYIKTTHCSSGCTWYSDHVTPSIHDQWLAQTSTLSKENYVYDNTGRLTEVQETPIGKGCTTRIYGLDENANRTSLITRAPGAEGQCAPEGGTQQRHLYDEGDRLIDEGVSYDQFGNTTALPAADAGGAALTSTYYVDNALASQTQSGVTLTYNLDPSGRQREAVSSGGATGTITSHYVGAGDAPAWTIDAGGKWTRNIHGVSGSLAAIQVNGGTPVLQLTNLHNDVVATAALSETETKLLSTTDTTEYGVPTTASPSHYSYLGGEQRATELPTGIIAMGARTYIPQLGRFEQTDPQPGGGANSYAYTGGDPVNGADPSGEWTVTTVYNYEAAEAGPAEAGLPEHYLAAGAIMPPPVDLQIEAEFNAHPPWGSAATFEAEPEANEFWVFEGGMNASAATNIFSEGIDTLKHFGSEVIHEANKLVEERFSTSAEVRRYTKVSWTNNAPKTRYEIFSCSSSFLIGWPGALLFCGGAVAGRLH